MTTRVIIGCSNWRDYAFPLPLTALLWREIAGYEPILLLVGDEHYWSKPARSLTSLNAIRELEFEHYMLGYIYGYEDCTLAQNSRQHAAALSTIPDDEWLMPSDADLWPLTREFYHQHEISDKRFVLYYSNGDHYSSFPTCHMTGRAKDWRALMGLILPEEKGGMFVIRENPITHCVKNTLEAWLKPRQAGKGPSDAGWEAWMSDQRIFTERIKAQTWYPQEVLMIERKGHPPVDRIDRCCWPINPSVRGMTDAHLPKAPDQEWDKIRPIVEQLLPNWLSWADKYRNEFIAGY